jgi:hypothetical protein
MRVSVVVIRRFLLRSDCRKAEAASFSICAGWIL